MNEKQTIVTGIKVTVVTSSFYLQVITSSERHCAFEIAPSVENSFALPIPVVIRFEDTCKRICNV